MDLDEFCLQPGHRIVSRITYGEKYSAFLLE